MLCDAIRSYTILYDAIRSYTILYIPICPCSSTGSCIPTPIPISPRVGSENACGVGERVHGNKLFLLNELLGNCLLPHCLEAFIFEVEVLKLRYGYVFLCLGTWYHRLCDTCRLAYLHSPVHVVVQVLWEFTSLLMLCGLAPPHKLVGDFLYPV